MKTREEVEAILNDPQAQQKLDMLKVVLDGEFTREELACMFTGVVQLFVPMMTAEAFKSYCDTMRATFNNTEAELDLVEEKKVVTLSAFVARDLKTEQYMVLAKKDYPTPIMYELSNIFGKDVRYEVMHHRLNENDGSVDVWLED